MLGELFHSMEELRAERMATLKRSKQLRRRLDQSLLQELLKRAVHVRMRTLTSCRCPPAACCLLQAALCRTHPCLPASLASFTEDRCVLTMADTTDGREGW